MIHIGDKLRNGAIVIARAGIYVAATWKRLHGREYISWILEQDHGQDTGNVYLGHYFMAPDKACSDMMERAAA